MWILTHTLSPVVAVAAGEALVLEKNRAPVFEARHYMLIGLGGALPDVLSPHLTLAARYASWSHSLWFLAVFVPVAFYTSRRLANSHWRLTAGLMVFAAGWHLFCDAIAGGIAWMYPFSGDIVGRYVVAAKWWPLLDAVSVVLAGALLFWIRWRKDALERADWPDD